MALDPPPVRQPFFDQNGQMSRIWWLWFVSLQKLVVATPETNVDDIAVLQAFSDVGGNEAVSHIDELRNIISALPQGQQTNFRQLFSDIQAQIDSSSKPPISKLQAQIDDLKKSAESPRNIRIPDNVDAQQVVPVSKITASVEDLRKTQGIPDPHGHKIGAIAGLQGALNDLGNYDAEKAEIGHGHPIGAIRGLQNALDALNEQLLNVKNIVLPTSLPPSGSAGGALSGTYPNPGVATITIVDDTTTNATMYPTWVTANSGSLPLKVSSTKVSLNPSTGTLTASAFSGPLTGNVTGNASGSSGSCTGNAATATALATARAIYGNNFDGTAALSQIIASTYGGTGNGFAKFSGPAASEKTFTLPNASAAILTDNAAVTVAQGGTGLGTLTAHNVIIGNGTSTPNFVAPGTSGNVLTSNGTDWISQAPAGGTGTVTSVTFTGDGTVLSSTPSTAVTTSGTLAASLKTQTANQIFAGPASGGAVAPTFRAMVAADIPSSIVSNAKLANMGSWAFKGNNTSSSSVPLDFTLLNTNSQNGAITVNASNFGNLLSFTASTDATWGFTAVATLGAGWWCVIKNDGTSNATITLDPNASEQIDGRTSYKMYPGEKRYVYCDGTKFTTQILRQFNFTTTATITFIPPPGYTGYRCIPQAGGGTGASRATTGNVTGGGGGGALDIIIPASYMSTSGETVTVGAVTNGQSGNANGTQGSSTSITASLGPGAPTYTVVGGGGGFGSVTAAAANAGLGGYPSSPIDMSSGQLNNLSLMPTWGWTSSGITTAAGNCFFSATGGGVNASNISNVGGSSYMGGAGGGSISSANGTTRSGGTAYNLNTTGSASATGANSSDAGIGCGSGAVVQGGTSGKGGAGQAQIIGVC